ncbi:hypothetical protein T4C_5023, partial [Trichinella pseudospiralis]
LSLLHSVTLDVDVLLETVRDEPYETLKSRLLERYGQWDDDRFNALTMTVARCWFCAIAVNAPELRQRFESSGSFSCNGSL